MITFYNLDLCNITQTILNVETKILSYTGCQNENGYLKEPAMSKEEILFNVLANHNL